MKEVVASLVDYRASNWTILRAVSCVRFAKQTLATRKAQAYLLVRSL